MPPRSRAWVEVDLDAMRANLETVRHRLPPGAGLVPMLKADAYGLGAEPVSRFLRRAIAAPGPWAFGVATVAEGEALRSFGWEGRVLVTSPIAPQEYLRAAGATLTLSISDLQALARWAEAAQRLDRRLAFHAEVDTGMGRAGFRVTDPAGWAADVKKAAGDRLFWEGCFTHYHSADEPDPEPTRGQWARFRSVIDRLPRKLRERPGWVVHAANSAAALRFPECAGDLARPGIFMYGGQIGSDPQPRPAASLRARLVLVREVPRGSMVGYGATYRASAPERWGTLALGYGDGLPRSLGGSGATALVHGRRVPIIGRVSMDVTTVDLSEVPEAMAGDVATFFGQDGEDEITLDEIAARAGTISYEVLTGLTPRLPRVYVGGGNSGAADAVVSQ